MGEVFTAVTFGAEGFRRKFVVKRLRVELARDPSVVAQFIDEANLASTLVHSNVVPVFDFGKVGDEYFLAQEYILGRDLARLARRSLEKEGRALTPAAALYAVHETLRALEYAHAKTGENGQPLGIVHRDVSPSNVMVSARGEVKLFDFGIVKANGRRSRTQVGMVKGNANFMSPEQARGHTVDARSDLYSLGLVLYYCLSNRLIYDGDNDLDVLYRAASGPTEVDKAAIAALPEPAASVLAQALAVDPADRFPDAAAFAAALEPHARGGKAATAKLMRHLFGEELQSEAA
jgi:serine/threonine protein kinase